jgi:hypothetical protein
MILHVSTYPYHIKYVLLESRLYSKRIVILKFYGSLMRYQYVNLMSPSWDIINTKILKSMN